MDQSLTVRIALANLPFPESPEEAIVSAIEGIHAAADKGARIVCFPECFLPGYRLGPFAVRSPDAAYLKQSWATIAQVARKANIGVVIGTEKAVDGALLISALVVNAGGAIAGFQDKNQLDPSEDSIYSPGSGRHLFEAGPLKFGISICHEGWRYPETVRWAVRQGAHVVFHPHYHWAEPGSYRPSTFADPANTFHEKSALCRAAENTCFFATVNYASEGSPTTSAVARPDGTLLCYQPYGVPGVLTADLNLDEATGLLARRYRPL